MENLNVPIYKIASASLTDISLLKIKKTKKPVIISTGMSNSNNENALIFLKPKQLYCTVIALTQLKIKS